MKKFFRGMLTNMGVVGEVLTLLAQRKRWWLIPLVVTLLAFGVLLVCAATSGIAPFIYTLF